MYPVFVDAAIRRTPDPRAFWEVPAAVQYLLATENGDETYVANPDFGTVSLVLVTYQPAPGSAVLDPTDPSTYQIVPVQVPDMDLANQPWPEAVADWSATSVFWRNSTSPPGLGFPVTTLDFYRRDSFSWTIPKPVYLDAEGAAINPATNNASAIHLSVDLNAIANAYQVETAQRQTEVSWILWPLYVPAATDATPGADGCTGCRTWRSERVDRLAVSPLWCRRVRRWPLDPALGVGHRAAGELRGDLPGGRRHAELHQPIPAGRQPDTRPTTIRASLSTWTCRFRSITGHLGEALGRTPGRGRRSTADGGSSPTGWVSR